MRCPRSDRRRQGGAALIVALLVFALCTALVVAMEVEFNRFYQRVGNLLLVEQADVYLRGAEELASLVLLADYDQDRDREQARDDLGEIWAQPTERYPLEDGVWLQGRLEDLQGRFNLNSLAAGAGRSEDGAPRFTPAQAQFIRLLQALDEPQVSELEAITITESVGDWLDPDIEPAPRGAEDDYYFVQEPAYRAANRPMASVSELQAVANVTPEIYRALEPLVTVWPIDPAPLNIHTAPAAVLRSINVDDDLQPLTQAQGEALVERRRDNGFVDVEDFLASPEFEGRAEQMEQTRTLLGQDSSYFLLTAQVEVAERNMRLYSVLQREGRQVSALVRAAGSL
jgi:general secretion pathway protein K